MVYLITGKAGAGKTHYAETLAAELEREGHSVAVVDGDVLRTKRKNEDFTDTGRIMNLMDAAQIAAGLEAEGKIVICAFVSPKREWRDAMREFWRMSIVVYIPGGSLWKGTKYERPTDGELVLHALYKAPKDRKLWQ
jgi:adenylylsulfate kinase